MTPGYGRLNSNPLGRARPRSFAKEFRFVSDSRHFATSWSAKTTEPASCWRFDLALKPLVWLTCVHRFAVSQNIAMSAVAQFAGKVKKNVKPCPSYLRR